MAKDLQYSIKRFRRSSDFYYIRDFSGSYRSPYESYFCNLVSNQIDAVIKKITSEKDAQLIRDLRIIKTLVPNLYIKKKYIGDLSKYKENSEIQWLFEKFPNHQLYFEKQLCYPGYVLRGYWLSLSLSNIYKSLLNFTHIKAAASKYANYTLSKLYENLWINEQKIPKLKKSVTEETEKLLHVFKTKEIIASKLIKDIFSISKLYCDKSTSVYIVSKNTKEIFKEKCRYKPVAINYADYNILDLCMEIEANEKILKDMKNNITEESEKKISDINSLADEILEISKYYSDKAAEAYNVSSETRNTIVQISKIVVKHI